MAQQPHFVWGVVDWIRSWFLPTEAEENRQQLEEQEQRLAERADDRQEQRFNLYNQILQRQRDVAQDLHLHAEIPEERPNPGELFLEYIFRVGDIAVPVRRISRSLVLIIEENGVRYRVDIIETHNDHIVAWAVRADRPGQ